MRATSVVVPFGGISLGPHGSGLASFSAAPAPAPDGTYKGGRHGHSGHRGDHQDWWALIYVAALIASTGVASAQDVVITTSGDRLVGEIQRVEKDVLTISTDYSDVDFKIG